MALLDITHTNSATCSTSIFASSSRECSIAIISDPNGNGRSAITIEDDPNGNSSSNAVIANDQKGNNTPGNGAATSPITTSDTASSVETTNSTSMLSFNLYNGDPVHIYAMIRQCTEGSPEWVVWDDWREFLGLPETLPHS